MGYEAGVKAMIDAGINYDDVEQAVACYVYGDSSCGQRVFYQFGTHMQIIHVYPSTYTCKKEKHLLISQDRYDTDTHLQRQQQLFDWLNRTIYGSTTTSTWCIQLCPGYRV